MGIRAQRGRGSPAHREAAVARPARVACCAHLDPERPQLRVFDEQVRIHHLQLEEGRNTAGGVSRPEQRWQAAADCTNGDVKWPWVGWMR